LSKNQKVVIAGAGIIGIACAHYLNKAGFEVVIFDRGKAGGACSRANCGYICPSHIPPLTEPGAIGVALKSIFNRESPFHLKLRPSPALWQWMWQFARRCTHQQVLQTGEVLQSILDASMEEYHLLMKRFSKQCEWQERGLLYVYETEEGMNAFAKTDQMLEENFGVSAKKMSGEQLVELEPGLRKRLAGAFHYPSDTSLNPESLNKSWVSDLKRRGVEFIEECELQKIEKQNGRVMQIKTSAGDLDADHFVFSLGAWSPKWSDALECKLPIEPGKGYSLTMDRPEGAPVYPMLFPEKKIGVSPFENGFRLGSMMEFVGYDKSIPAHRLKLLRDSARPFLRSDVDGPAQDIWYGWRPMTWDSLPIVGQVPQIDNAYLATGHNMLGLSLAPSTGRLIKEMICGDEPHIDPSAYSPLRF
jgi:D-amino-acid dehydrogenase